MLTAQASQQASPTVSLTSTTTAIPTSTSTSTTTPTNLTTTTMTPSHTRAGRRSRRNASKTAFEVISTTGDSWLRAQTQTQAQTKETKQPVHDLSWLKPSVTLFWQRYRNPHLLLLALVIFLIFLFCWASPLDAGPPLVRVYQQDQQHRALSLASKSKSKHKDNKLDTLNRVMRELHHWFPAGFDSTSVRSRLRMRRLCQQLASPSPSPSDSSLLSSSRQSLTCLKVDHLYSERESASVSLDYYVVPKDHSRTASRRLVSRVSDLSRGTNYLDLFKPMLREPTVCANLSYLHVHKCGGTSVIAVMKHLRSERKWSLFESPLDVREWLYRLPRRFVVDHRGLLFTFVRDPLQRFLSSYHEARLRGLLPRVPSSESDSHFVGERKNENVTIKNVFFLTEKKK